jgi:hypothetical protein
MQGRSAGQGLADLLRSGFGGLVRSVAVKEAVKGAEVSLESLKEGLESAGWRVT